MLLRKRSDPSIIIAVARGTDAAMVIKSADKHYAGVYPAGTMFAYKHRQWFAVDPDKDDAARNAYEHYVRATGNASVPPMR